MMINNTPATERSDLEDPYLVAEHPATPSCLVSLLKKQIQQNGPMPLDQWMQHCLYHPQFGYYTQGELRVGREGDFFTSVSVGKCFGMLIAHRIANYFSEHPSERYDIIEIGANTGQLASDILDTLRDEFPALYAQLHYTIAEHLPQMQQQQTQTLARHSEILSFIPSLESLSQPKSLGIILSNELIDAFPVQQITREDNTWRECMIDLDPENPEQFIRITQDLSTPELRAFAATLPEHKNGYTTEFRPRISHFTENCARAIQRGLVITIDYGYDRQDYYAAHRSSGTLRTFFQHTAGEDPISHPGEQDITAHVDFTQLTEAFTAAGFQPTYFDSQARYLTAHARTWFAAIESSDAPPPTQLIRQFQTLTHPSMMGAQFVVLECSKATE